MARLFTAGAETANDSGEGISTSVGTGISYATDRARTGSYAWKIASTCVSSYKNFTLPATTGRWYYGRWFVNIDSIAAIGGGANGLEIGAMENNGGTWWYAAAKCKNDGTFWIEYGASSGPYIPGMTNLATFADDTWYCIELGVYIASGSGADDRVIVRLNGSEVFDSGLVAFSTVGPNMFHWGHNNATAAGTAAWIDDVACNDDTGTNDTSWPGTGTDYDFAVRADYPLLYWRLNESSGAPADSSGNARNGAWSAGPAAYNAGALRLGGDSVDLERDSSHRATIADAAWMQGIATVEAWITVESLPGTSAYHTISDKGDVWNIYLYYDGGTRTIEVSSHTGAGAYGIWKWTWTPELDKPYHVAWAWTVNAGNWAAGDMDFYLNGALYTTGKAYSTTGGTPSGSYIDNTTALNLGAYFTGVDYWDGKVSDFALYGSVLSSDRIAAHFNAGDIPPPWTPGSDSTFLLNAVSRSGARV